MATSGICRTCSERWTSQRWTGILLDLGVSSPQLDDPERGFSYQHDAPLDMRMDQTQPLTAAVVVNEWSEGQLKDVLRNYGEERYAGAIAGAIVRKRQEAPIETTRSAGGRHPQRHAGRRPAGEAAPAKRTFQGIRIAVNDELAAVSDVVAGAIPCSSQADGCASSPSTRWRIASSSSSWPKRPRGAPARPEFPVCICGKKPQITLKPRKPILPSQEELERNPRARSAKLRVAEKVPN